jgi:hypothetical protein
VLGFSSQRTTRQLSGNRTLFFFFSTRFNLRGGGLLAGKVVEMSAVEKQAVIAAIPKPVKRKENVMHEIYIGIPGAEFLTFLDACDKHPSFVFALEMGAIEVAKQILRNW